MTAARAGITAAAEVRGATGRKTNHTAVSFITDTHTHTNTQTQTHKHRRTHICPLEEKLKPSLTHAGVRVHTNTHGHTFRGGEGPDGQGGEQCPVSVREKERNGKRARERAREIWRERDSWKERRGTAARPEWRS